VCLVSITLLKHVKEREEREARRRRGEEENIEIPKARPIPPRRNSSTSSPSHPPKKRENTLSLSLIEKAKKRIKQRTSASIPLAVLSYPHTRIQVLVKWRR
jgi:hypothetical protein